MSPILRKTSSLSKQLKSGPDGVSPCDLGDESGEETEEEDCTLEIGEKGDGHRCPVCFGYFFEKGGSVAVCTAAHIISSHRGQFAYDQLDRLSADVNPDDFPYLDCQKSKTLCEMGVTGKPVFACSKCQKVMKTFKHLKQHAPLHEKSVDRAHWMCTICSRVVRPMYDVTCDLQAIIHLIMNHNADLDVVKQFSHPPDIFPYIDVKESISLTRRRNKPSMKCSKCEKVLDVFHNHKKHAKVHDRKSKTKGTSPAKKDASSPKLDVSLEENNSGESSTSCDLLACPLQCGRSFQKTSIPAHVSLAAHLFGFHSKYSVVNWLKTRTPVDKWSYPFWDVAKSVSDKADRTTKLFACSLCDVKLKSFAQLSGHASRRHPTNLSHSAGGIHFYCVDCETNVAYRQLKMPDITSKVVHYLFKHPEMVQFRYRSFSDVVRESFPFIDINRSLRNWEESYRQQMMLACALCVSDFTQFDNLIRHTRAVHSQEMVAYYENNFQPKIRLKRKPVFVKKADTSESEPPLTPANASKLEVLRDPGRIPKDHDFEDIAKMYAPKSPVKISKKRISLDSLSDEISASSPKRIIPKANMVKPSEKSRITPNISVPTTLFDEISGEKLMSQSVVSPENKKNVEKFSPTEMVSRKSDHMSNSALCSFVNVTREDDELMESPVKKSPDFAKKDNVVISLKKKKTLVTDKPKERRQTTMDLFMKRKPVESSMTPVSRKSPRKRTSTESLSLEQPSKNKTSRNKSAKVEPESSPSPAKRQPVVFVSTPIKTPTPSPQKPSNSTSKDKEKKKETKKKVVFRTLTTLFDELPSELPSTSQLFSQSQYQEFTDIDHKADEDDRSISDWNETPNTRSNRTADVPRKQKKPTDLPKASETKQSPHKRKAADRLPVEQPTKRTRTPKKTPTVVDRHYLSPSPAKKYIFARPTPSPRKPLTRSPPQPEKLRRGRSNNVAEMPEEPKKKKTTFETLFDELPSEQPSTSQLFSQSQYQTFTQEVDTDYETFTVERVATPDGVIEAASLFGGHSQLIHGEIKEESEERYLGIRPGPLNKSRSEVTLFSQLPQLNKF